MPVPSSGPLSISTIRGVGVSGGCTPSGQAYSLSALANNFGIGNNPDRISDFYGLSCPGGPTCIAEYFSAGYDPTEVCCSSFIIQLSYYDNGYAYGSAGNPLRVDGSCGSTLYNGYISVGGIAYNVTNGVMSFILCPICPEPSECSTVTIYTYGKATLVQYVYCCGYEVQELINNGGTICVPPRFVDDILVDNGYVGEISPNTCNCP
jgi:hypothetical protein